MTCRFFAESNPEPFRMSDWKLHRRVTKTPHYCCWLFSYTVRFILWPWSVLSNWWDPSIININSVVYRTSAMQTEAVCWRRKEKAQQRRALTRLFRSVLALSSTTRSAWPNFWFPCLKSVARSVCQGGPRHMAQPCSQKILGIIRCTRGAFVCRALEVVLKNLNWTLWLRLSHTHSRAVQRLSQCRSLLAASSYHHPGLDYHAY